MRRKDREMPESFARYVLETCDWCTLAMQTPEGLPYAVPLSVVCHNDVIYFHAAKVGLKKECLLFCPTVCLVAVRDVQLIPEHFTTEYASAIVHGRAEEVFDDAEKREALRLLCLRYAPEHMGNFESALERSWTKTAIWKIHILSITGKRKKYSSSGEELRFAAGWPPE